MNTSYELGRKFAEDHPADAARILERERPEEIAAFLKEIPGAAAADVARRMNLSLAAASLVGLEVEDAASVIERLPLFHAAQLLRRSDPNWAESVLERLGEGSARPLRRLLRYREGTAGALADPQVLSLPVDINVAEAQKQLQRLGADALYNVYVTDREHHLVGAVTIRQLLRARPRQPLESLMQRQLVSLTASLDLAAVAASPAWLKFDMLPVVDNAGVLLGVIRHKTIRQLAAAGESGPGLAGVIDLALNIADMYWTSLSGLAASIAVVAAAQHDAVSDGSGR
jgi:magnesium transporter